MKNREIVKRKYEVEDASNNLMRSLTPCGALTVDPLIRVGSTACRCCNFFIEDDAINHVVTCTGRVLDEKAESAT